MAQTTRGKIVTLAALAASAGLAACADLSRATALVPAGVNVESPVAATVADASRRSYPYPRFKRLPLKPKATDIRKPESFKAEVAQLGARQASLKGWAASNPAFVSDTDAYADAQRKRLPEAVGAAAPPPDQADRTEAWAKALRDAAQPPPPPK